MFHPYVGGAPRPATVKGGRESGATGHGLSFIVMAVLDMLAGSGDSGVVADEPANPRS